jgi:hypothetical protein
MNTPWRLAALVVFVIFFTGCANPPKRPEGLIDVVATSQGKPLPGADCTARTLSGSWSVQTPGTVNVGTPNGDLHIVCHLAGYRTSEVIIRAPAAAGLGGARVSVGAGGGFGGYSGGGMSLGFGFPIVPARAQYPASLVVEMMPTMTPADPHP